MREGLQKIVSVDETIVAISTPLGRSGLGIVRISGKKAIPIAQRFFRSPAPLRFEHRLATVGSWIGTDGEPIDEVVITPFHAPHSYTGEDVIEISGHGNPLILRCIVETACSAGARLASAGEFTLRGVANGKLDLIQAEAVRDFIEAVTEQQARTALRQLGGSLSSRIWPIKDKLVDLIAHLEAGIDFAEDDVDVPLNAAISDAIRPLSDFLKSLLASFGYGRTLVEGLQLVILGKPNVGKSSLFNCLIAADRAIVTDVPGTTRDVLRETTSVEGVPLRFLDTAGMRQTTDPVESIGVKRALEALTEADLALVVLDGSGTLDEDDRQVLSCARSIRHLVIINKSDLPQAMDLTSLNGSPHLHLSAKTGQGVNELRAAIGEFLAGERTDLADDLILTSTRQCDAIGRAFTAMNQGCEAVAQSIPHEMVLLDLYAALSALDELTGDIVTEDILDRVFSTFCVGK